MSIMQNLIEGDIDIQAFSLFFNADADAEIPRRLNLPVQSLSHYEQYLEALKSVYTQTDGMVTVDGIAVKPVTVAVRDAIDAAILGDYKTQLEQQIASVAGGRKSYKTYAEMVAKKAEITTNSIIDITNDTAENNGAYNYDGTTFTKSTYDPLTQAKTYTDTAKTAAIFTAATDATSKANAAKSEAINAAVAYTDEKINKIDLATPVLTGQQLYDKALQNPTLLFNAIWSEYNKPVWHVGAGKFVDAVGATVSVVKAELIFTLKATQENQSFYFPTGNIAVTDPVMNVDWGDGTTSIVMLNKYRHDYTCAIGDEFTLTCTGYIEGFVFPAIRASSGAMLKSIDKNTLPKTMGQFSLKNCINLKRVCDGAFNSYAGTNLNLEIGKENPNLVLSSGMFKGLSNVTNIDNLFSKVNQVYNGTLPSGLFDPFINVTSARECLVGLTTVVPTGLLDKMTKLDDVYRFLNAGTGATLDSNLFKNQKHLKNVSYCFSANKSVADASVLYTDIVRGNPSATELCFATVSNMTNRDSVPAGWK